MEKLKPYLFPIILVILGIAISNIKETTRIVREPNSISVLVPKYKDLGMIIALAGIVWGGYKMYQSNKA